MLSRAVCLGNRAAQRCGGSIHDATMPCQGWWEQALAAVQGGDYSALRAVRVTLRGARQGLVAILDVREETMTREIN